MTDINLKPFAAFQGVVEVIVNRFGFGQRGAADNDNALDIGVVLGDDVATIAMIDAFNRLIAPHQKRLGMNVAFHDGSLPNRFRTDGHAFKDFVNAVARQPAAVMVKAPGRTPSAAEAKSLTAALDVDYQKLKDPLGKGSSPNAWWRKLFDVTLLRGFIPNVFDVIKQPDLNWKNNNHADASSVDPNLAMTVLRNNVRPASNSTEVVFVSQTGATEKLAYLEITAGAPFEVQLHDSNAYAQFIRRELQAALENRQQPCFMAKGTVMKGVDGEGLFKQFVKIYKEEFQWQFVAAGIPEPILDLNSCIVDAAIANFVARGRPTDANTAKRAIIPNGDYGPALAAAVEALKKEGVVLNFEQTDLIVSRYSGGTGSHYGAANGVFAEDGVVIVRSGDKVEVKDVKKGDMWLARTDTIESMRDYAKNCFDQALTTGCNFVEFGFDRNSPYDAPLVAAIEEVYVSGGYAEKFEQANPKITFDPTVDIKAPTQLYVDTLVRLKIGKGFVACSNLHGDFVTDILPALGGSIAIADSVGINKNGSARVIEAGTGGSAIDLMEEYLATGVLKYNPLAIVSSLSQAVAQKGRERNDSDLLTFAEDMQKAVLKVYSERHMVTGDLRAAFVQKNPDVQSTTVDTRVFLAAVTVELNQLQADRQTNPMSKEFFLELASWAEAELATLIVSLKIEEGYTPGYQSVDLERQGVTPEQQGVQQQNMNNVLALIDASKRVKEEADLAAGAEQVVRHQARGGEMPAR
jgi:isocitrate dehydrogenase